MRKRMQSILERVKCQIGTGQFSDVYRKILPHSKVRVRDIMLSSPARVVLKYIKEQTANGGPPLDYSQIERYYGQFCNKPQEETKLCMETLCLDELVNQVDGFKLASLGTRVLDFLTIVDREAAHEWMVKNPSDTYG